MKILHTVSICCCVLLCVAMCCVWELITSRLCHAASCRPGVRCDKSFGDQVGRREGGGVQEGGVGKEREGVYVRVCVCVLEGEVRVHKG